VKVDVQQVNLEFVKNFPHVAIALNHASVISNDSRHDTLLTADHIYLQFNILKIIRKKYIIEGIGLSNARVQIDFDSSGNFAHPLLIKKDNSDTSSEIFDIRRIVIKNTELYIRIQQKEKISAQIHQLRFNGEIKPEFLKGQVVVNSEKIKMEFNSENKYIKNLKITTDLYRDSLKSNLSGKFQINHENFTATISLNKKFQKIEFKGYKIKGKNIDTFLPRDIFKTFPNPKFDLQAAIVINNDEGRHIKLKAQCVLNDNEMFVFRNLTGKISGTFNYEGQLPEQIHRIDIKQANIHTQRSQLSVSGSISGRQNQWESTASGTGVFAIEEFSHIFDSLTIKLSEGKVQFTFTAKKQATSVDKLFTENDWEYNIEANTENASGSFYQSKLDSCTVQLVIRPEHMRIDWFRCQWFNSAIAFAGNITMKPYPQIEGKLKFDKIDIDKVLSMINKSDTSNSNIHFRIQLQADAGSFKNMPFGQLHTNIVMSDSIFKINDLSANFLNGQLTGINFVNEGVTYSLNGKINHADVRQLVQLAENFGFTQIKKDNVAGKINVSVQLNWSDKNNKIQYDKMLGKFNITITQGRLIQYEPIKDIMKYINIRNPEDIRLKPLQIEINIKDNNIWVKPMEIQSSAIDFTVWGNHSFDNQYEYHFKFYLTDILKKQNQTKMQNIPVTEVEDSTRMAVVFLLLKGTGSQYKISYDTQSTLTRFRERWKTEQKTLRSIIKEETGGAKNTEATEKMDSHNKTNRPRVIMEETAPGQEQPKKAAKTDAKKRPGIEWKDDDN